MCVCLCACTCASVVLFRCDPCGVDEVCIWGSIDMTSPIAWIWHIDLFQILYAIVAKYKTKSAREHISSAIADLCASLAMGVHPF